MYHSRHEEREALVNVVEHPVYEYRSNIQGSSLVSRIANVHGKEKAVITDPAVELKVSPTKNLLSRQFVWMTCSWLVWTIEHV
jgi:hypothetical protein